MAEPSPGPWEFSGQLIVSAPVPYPNPKSEPMGKHVASLAWDYDGDCGAPEYRIKWPEAKANGMVIIHAERTYRSLKCIVGFAREAMKDMPPSSHPADQAAEQWLTEAEALLAEIEAD